MMRVPQIQQRIVRHSQPYSVSTDMTARSRCRVLATTGARRLRDCYAACLGLTISKFGNIRRVARDQCHRVDTMKSDFRSYGSKDRQALRVSLPGMHGRERAARAGAGGAPAAQALLQATSGYLRSVDLRSRHGRRKACASQEDRPGIRAGSTSRDDCEVSQTTRKGAVVAREPRFARSKCWSKKSARLRGIPVCTHLFLPF